jgi:hypothetical protein
MLTPGQGQAVLDDLGSVEAVNLEMIFLQRSGPNVIKLFCP